MAHYDFEHFLYPYSSTFLDEERGPWYWRTASGIGEEIEIGRDYYWLERWIQDQNGAYFKKRRIIYYKGYKRVDREYDPDLENNVIEVTDYYTYRRNSYPYKEIIDTGPGNLDNDQYFEYWVTRTRGFATDYDWRNSTPTVPYTLVAVDDKTSFDREFPNANPYDPTVGQMDVYTYGMRCVLLDSAADYSLLGKSTTPLGVNCDVGMRFGYTKVLKGVFRVSQDVYNSMHTSLPSTTTHATLIHDLGKETVQRVRHKYTSSGQYYIRTDEYYSGSSQLGNGNVDLYYSDSRWSAAKLGGIDFLNYSPSTPNSVDFIGNIKASVGDYIYTRDRENVLKITAKDSTNYGTITFDQPHPYTEYLGLDEELYYSNTDDFYSFPIDWDYPPTNTNFINCYKAFAVYPHKQEESATAQQDKEYFLRFRFAGVDGRLDVGVRDAVAGFYGNISTGRKETLTLDMQRSFETDMYVYNQGHHNNGFEPVPQGEVFMFNVEILNPPSQEVIDYIEDSTWESAYATLTNCELTGDVYNIKGDFALRPTIPNEHFQCELIYKLRPYAGAASPIYFHVLVKGFALPVTPQLTYVVEDTMYGHFYDTTANKAGPADVAGDSEVQVVIRITEPMPLTDLVMDVPQEVRIEPRGTSNAELLDTSVRWTHIGNNVYESQPLTVIPTGDPWSIDIRAAITWMNTVVRIVDARYYPDMGLQVWNENGETRLNTSSRTPRIIYAFSGNVDYPVGLIVPELLIRFNRVSFTTVGGNHDVVSSNDYLVVDYATKRFGVASANFREGSPHIDIPKSDDFKFGTGDFTIDFQLYPRERSGHIYEGRDDGSHQNRPLIYFSSGKLAYHINGSRRIHGTATLALNQWHHIALCRKNGVTRLFVNGVQDGSSYTDNHNILSHRIRIGAQYNSGNYKLNGNIDEFRVLKNNAQYSTTFSPPQSEHFGNTDFVITDTEIPELIELPDEDDGSFHITFTSDKGQTTAYFDYLNKTIVLTKAQPNVGGFWFPSSTDYARFQVMRL